MSIPPMVPAQKVRTRQWTLIALVLAGGFAVTSAVLYMTGDKTVKPKKTTPAANVRLAPSEEEEDHFKAVFESRVRHLEEELQKRKNREKELSDQISVLKTDRDAMRREITLASKKAENEDGWPPREALAGSTVKLPPAPAPSRGFASGSRRALPQVPEEETETRRPRLVITEVREPSVQEKKPIPQKALTYLPSGTFAKARLLNGAIAPTRGQGSGNPVPMLLELTDNAVMPNLYRSGIKRCFITANATGELASERVLVRLDRLSCIDDEGGAVDTKLQGYVSGEDGKTGLRARLVTKSGQAIANALFTGTLSGLGRAVSLAAEQSNTSVMGSVSTTVKNPWRAGLGDGTSHAMDRITDYYLKLASDMFPVLEVDSGREVEVVISQGISIERLAKEKKK